jgi:hypothetical protein
MIWLLPHPLPLSLANSLYLSVFLCVAGHSDKLMIREGGKGMGEEPIHMTARKPDPLLY